MNHDEYIPKLNDVYKKYGIRGINELVLDCEIENQPDYLFDIANILIFFHKHKRMDLFYSVMRYDNSSTCLNPILTEMCKSDDVTLLDFFKLKRIYFAGIDFNIILFLVGNNCRKQFLYYLHNQKMDFRGITLVFRQFSILHMKQKKYHHFYFKKMMDKLLSYPEININDIFNKLYWNQDCHCLYLLFENYDLKFNTRKKYEIHCKIDPNVKESKAFKEYMFNKLPKSYQDRILKDKRIWV